MKLVIQLQLCKTSAKVSSIRISVKGSLVFDAYQTVAGRVILWVVPHVLNQPDVELISVLAQSDNGAILDFLTTISHSNSIIKVVSQMKITNNFVLCYNIIQDDQNLNDSVIDRAISFCCRIQTKCFVPVHITKPTSLPKFSPSLPRGPSSPRTTQLQLWKTKMPLIKHVYEFGAAISYFLQT